MKMSLRAIRINNGWSLERTAKLYNVSVDTVRNYEKGKTQPTVEIIYNILNATGMKFEDINFFKIKNPQNGFTVK